MISRLRGLVESVAENRAELRQGDLVYEVLIPAYMEGLLRPLKGEIVELFVQHYLEGGPASSALIPRLVGFLTEPEREFYQRLIKVPGVGAKSALKAMVVLPGEIARAIEGEDTLALARLPGVGKRTADKIIASLKGKMAEFAALAEGEKLQATSLGETEEEAVQVLMKLDYRRHEAEQLVRKIKRRDPDLATAEAIVQAAFKETGSGGRR